MRKRLIKVVMSIVALTALLTLNVKASNLKQSIEYEGDEIAEAICYELQIASHYVRMFYSEVLKSGCDVSLDAIGPCTDTDPVAIKFYDLLLDNLKYGTAITPEDVAGIGIENVRFQIKKARMLLCHSMAVMCENQSSSTSFVNDAFSGEASIPDGPNFDLDCADQLYGVLLQASDVVNRYYDYLKRQGCDQPIQMIVGCPVSEPSVQRIYDALVDQLIHQTILDPMLVARLNCLSGDDIILHAQYLVMQALDNMCSDHMITDN